MGRNLTIYFDDECLSYIEGVEGRNGLINNLIKQHFRNDEENLRRRLQEVDFQRKEIIRKLDHFESEKVRKMLAEQKKIELTEQQIEEKEIREKLDEMLRKDLISIDQWFEAKRDINKAKELVI